MTEDAVAEHCEQTAVERLQLVVCRLVRPSAEEHGQLHLPALHLALVDEARARLGHRGDGSGPGLVGREGRRGTWLVVVLDEADEALLIRGVAAQVAANLVAALVHEPVVQALVVTEAEAVLLERPLEIPVGLGKEDEARVPGGDSRNHGVPVLPGRPRAGALAPRALEDVVQHQHRHVAADSVALLGDVLQRLDDGLAQRRSEGVELHDVGPRGKVRVAAVREHAPGDLGERRRITRAVVLSAGDEVLRVRLRPRMVGRDVVRDEVEDQTEPASGKRGPCRRKALRTAQALVDDVAPDAIGRADDVLRAEVGERAPEAFDEPGVGECDRDPCRAPLPDAHQPDDIEPERRDRVPLPLGHVAKVDRHSLTARQVLEPHPGVELVDERVGRQRRPRCASSLAQPGRRPRRQSGGRLVRIRFRPAAGRAEVLREALRAQSGKAMVESAATMPALSSLALTTLRPNGTSAAPAILKSAIPSGMPMIVRQSATPVRT